MLLHLEWDDQGVRIQAALNKAAHANAKKNVPKQTLRKMDHRTGACSMPLCAPCTVERPPFDLSVGLIRAPVIEKAGALH